MRKFCHTKNDVPKTKHWAIVEFSEYTIPGDERSRTNPGHGYPENRDSKAEYVAYDNRDEWLAEISRMMAKTGYYREDFVALVVEPAAVVLRTEVVVHAD